MSRLADPDYDVRRAPELRIANPPPSLLVKYTRKEKDFFDDYANFVLRLMEEPGVSARIRRILATERVSINGPIDIRVMVFPARSFRGQANRMLHGSYNSTSSRISLYPLRVPRDWIRHDGHDLFRQPFADLSLKRRTLLDDISLTAISTLLHEIFHVKLGPRGMAKYGEEKIVKSMEEDYMKGWEEIVAMAVRNASSQTRIS